LDGAQIHGPRKNDLTGLLYLQGYTGTEIAHPRLTNS
jgi:hypothetical protein